VLHMVMSRGRNVEFSKWEGWGHGKTYFSPLTREGVEYKFRKFSYESCLVIFREKKIQISKIDEFGHGKIDFLLIGREDVKWKFSYKFVRIVHRVFARKKFEISTGFIEFSPVTGEKVENKFRKLSHKLIAKIVRQNKCFISNHNLKGGWSHGLLAPLQYFCCIFEAKIVLILKIVEQIRTDKLVL